MDCCACSIFFGGFVVFVIGCFLSSKRKTYSIYGKHILITGGSSGIGKCIASQSLKRGASLVTLVARNKDKLIAVKEELQSTLKLSDKQKINVISADVGEKGIVSKITEGLSDIQPVDVLVNSAGITHTDDFLQTDRDVFESIMKTNLIGTVEVTRAILPSMIDRRDGRIVFVCSQAGQFPMYGYTAYASSKFALRGFAEVLQMEVKPYNIKISVSYPPDTDTPQLEQELKLRSPMVAELATYSTTLKPDQIATEIMDGIELGQFSISHGFDGLMLKTATAGVAPVSSVLELITQFSLMGVFRVIALWYLRQFNTIVSRSLKKKT